MTLYRYKAIDEVGKRSTGVMDMASEFELEQRLRSMGMELIVAREHKTLLPNLVRKSITRRDLINFCFHLLEQTRAGVPLIEGLKDLRDSVDNPALREITSSLVERIEGGASLSQAMDDFPYAFDQVFVAMIRAGERSGRLVEILRSLTENLKWQDELVTQTKKAFMYPIFVLVCVLGVVVALMVFLVPELVKFIMSTGQQLPGHTKALIWVSEMMRSYIHWGIGAVFALVALFKYLQRVSAKFRYSVDQFKLTVWVLGPVLRKLLVSRFTQYFALLYAAGITVPECLRISEEIVGNRYLAGAIGKAAKILEEGAPLSASFERTRLFPPLVLRMLKVGETTGALDSALTNIGYFFNRDVQDAIDRMQTMIGPTMTVILGGILLWVIVSVMGPIYNTISTVVI